MKRPSQEYPIGIILVNDTCVGEKLNKYRVKNLQLIPSVGRPTGNVNPRHVNPGLFNLPLLSVQKRMTKPLNLLILDLNQEAGLV